MTLPVLKTRNCRWIDVPGASDARGSVNFLQRGKGLDFEPKRLLFLYDVAQGQWRGPRSHRGTQLVFIAVNGSCRVRLDDGAVEEIVTLDDPTKALYVAPWIWHELTGFAPGTAIVALGSGPCEEAECLRDYEVFRREVGMHVR